MASPPCATTPCRAASCPTATGLCTPPPSATTPPPSSWTGEGLGEDVSGGFPVPRFKAIARWEGGWLGGDPLAVPSPSCSASCRLKPFTSYKFRVKATNDIGDSEYSEESESLTTLQAGQHLLGQGQPGHVRGNSSSALGISGASPPSSPPQPPRRLPPSSPSPPTPPRRCSSAGRYRPFCPALGGDTGTSRVAPEGTREPWIGAASDSFPPSPCSHQLRIRSMGSCWGSGCATGSWCMTACGASPCAASATPAPAGPSSPVSAHCPPWGQGLGALGVTGGDLSSAASRAPQHSPGTRVRPCSLELSPVPSCHQGCGP